MQPIETDAETVEDAGVRFVVRCLSSLARKEEERWRRERDARGGRSRDPFFPPEPDLLVGEISDTHLAVLNKFNVIGHHLLLVTRRYADQETLLDDTDFEALAACLRDIDGLGFYNGGTIAGASQAHKHLQFAPLPLAPEDPVPVAVLFGQALERPGIRQVPGLPFPHALTRLEPHLLGAPERLGERYRELLAAMGVNAIGKGAQARQSAPYNLLVSRLWMLAVPRVRECFDSVSINALGFAGSLFVRDAEQLAAVKRAGPMTVLKHVAGDRTRSAPL